MGFIGIYFLAAITFLVGALFTATMLQQITTVRENYKTDKYGVEDLKEHIKKIKIDFIVATGIWLIFSGLCLIFSNIYTDYSYFIISISYFIGYFTGAILGALTILHPQSMLKICGMSITK